MLNPADPGEPKGRCAIHLSNGIATMEGAQTFDLSSYADEIYDILVLQ